MKRPIKRVTEDALWLIFAWISVLRWDREPGCEVLMSSNSYPFESDKKGGINYYPRSLAGAGTGIPWCLKIPVSHLVVAFWGLYDTRDERGAPNMYFRIQFRAFANNAARTLGFCISHLCHRKRCVKSDHLWPESMRDHRARLRCLVVELVRGSYRSACTHPGPRCIATRKHKTAARRRAGL